MSIQNRNPSVELLRVLMVFGICWLHAITTCARINSPLSRINYFLYPCVVGFVFITGWFGISFSWRRLLKLYGVSAYCALVAWVVHALESGRCSLDPLLAILKDNWFLKGYVVVMLFAPIVNLALERKPAIKTFAPFLALVFGWTFLACAPRLGELIPQSPGLSAYSGITMLGIYLAARIVRVYDLEARLKHVAIWVIPVSILAVALHYGSYASPFALTLAAFTFLWIKDCRAGWSEKLWFWMSPSLLSVFLLHASPYGFSLMTRGELWLMHHGVQTDASYFLVACATFVVAFILDIPRRVGLSLWKRYI